MKPEKQTKTADGAARGRVVLVGTYRGDQLKDWPGWYCWPLDGEQCCQCENVASAQSQLPIKAMGKLETGNIGNGNTSTLATLSSVTELRLYRGTADERRYRALFVGVKTREELIRDYGYPGGDVSATKNAKIAKGGSRLSRPQKPHGSHYALFKTELLYRHRNDLPGEADAVIVRLTDFVRSPKVRKQLREYLESPDRNNPDLAKLLPSIVTSVPPERLKVCEAWQDNFLSVFFMRQIPTTEPITYADADLRASADLCKMPETPDHKPYRMGEFFCGPGGLACGAMNARIENPNFTIVHAWANDYDQQTCNTYAENICPECPQSVICADVRKLDLSDARLTGIDGFAFGFPCNDFSVVGEHKGFEGNFGPLYQYGIAVLKRFKPQWFFAENVGGLASANEGAAFKTILSSMKDAGYRVYPHLYKFEEYGVPQTRHRIIIIGIRQDLPFVFYPPSPAALSARDNTARHALEEPPIPATAPNNDKTAQNARVVERLQYIRPGQNAFTANLPEHLRFWRKCA